MITAICAYCITFSDVQLHVAMLTEVTFDSNGAKAVPVRSFYVCTACVTFPMHVFFVG